MPLELIEDGYGNPNNALALAAACQFAYSPEDEGKAQFRDEFDMEAAFLSVDNTQAYVATNDEHILVIFRGSQDPTTIDGLKDWLLTNAVNLLIQPEGDLSTEFLAAGVGARFHQGFVNAITEIWPQLFALVEAKTQEYDRPVWIAGHSLGGALAKLAAWLFKRKFINVHQIYTYGAPMVGNAEAAKAIDREFPNSLFRYVNNPDPVPLLPMMSLVSNAYVHGGTLVALGDNEAANNLLVYLKDSAGEAIEGVFSGEISEKVWERIKARAMAHLLNDYRGLLQKSPE